MHPVTMYELAKGRQADLLREAERWRLAHPSDDAAAAGVAPATVGRRSRAAGFASGLVAVRGWVARPARRWSHARPR
jgi:hypothetical protein